MCQGTRSREATGDGQIVLQRLVDASSELGAWDGRSPPVPFAAVLLSEAPLGWPRACLKERRRGMEARSVQATQMAERSAVSCTAFPHPASGRALTGAQGPDASPLRGAAGSTLLKDLPPPTQTTPPAAWA